MLRISTLSRLLSPLGVLALLLVGAQFLCSASQAKAAEIVVYSARNEQLIKPIFDAYTKETGVEIKFATGNEGALMERLKAEGANSPADILLTVDAGNLWQAGNEGLLQKLDSKVLKANIPAHLRDPDDQWFGMSVRARTMVYSTERVKPGELTTYEDLADPKWKGRLLLRTSKKVYNQSLVGMLIAQHGIPATEKIVAGWVANLAADPFGSDNQVIEAVAAGQGDVGLVNTYYFAKLMKDKPGMKVAIFWPNQKEGQSGVHVNVSGAGLTKHAKNSKDATAFLEWLSSEKAQGLFAELNMEFPANPAVKPAPAVAAWGEFRQNPINVAKAGEFQAEATKLMDRMGYK